MRSVAFFFACAAFTAGCAPKPEDIQWTDPEAARRPDHQAMKRGLKAILERKPLRYFDLVVAGNRAFELGDESIPIVEQAMPNARPADRTFLCFWLANVGGLKRSPTAQKDTRDWLFEYSQCRSVAPGRPIPRKLRRAFKLDLREEPDRVIDSLVRKSVFRPDPKPFTEMVYTRVRGEYTRDWLYEIRVPGTNQTYLRYRLYLTTDQKRALCKIHYSGYGYDTAEYVVVLRQVDRDWLVVRRVRWFIP